MIGTNKKVNIQSNSDFHIFDNLQEEVVVYEIMRDMDIVVDLHVKYMNNAAIINRIVPEESIGKSITELYNVDVAALHLKIVNKILKSGEGKKYEVYFEPLNRYYSVSAYLSDDNTFITINRDITGHKKVKEELRQVRDNLEEKIEERTAKLEESNEILKNEIKERKLIEETFRESEHKFRNVIEQAYNGIMLCDEQGIIIEWNKAQEKITGIKQDEAIGKFIGDVSFHRALEELKTPEAYKKLKTALLKMFKTGKIPWDNPVRELEIQGPDGKRRFIEDRVFIIQTDKGFMACSVTQDVTDRKTMEETLRKSEHKFRSVIEQSYNGIALCNEQGVIIEWNHAQEIITGKKRKEVIGKFLWDVLFHLTTEELKTPEVYEHLKTALLTVFERGKIPLYTHAQEMEIQRPDGKRRFVEQQVSTIKTDKGFMSCAIIQDITERKKAEKQLKGTVEELKRSNEELQRFAYVASHDLQEPLRTIASFTQLLERRYKGKLDSDADEFIDYIVEAALRMKELIEALLDYSRVATKAGEFKSVDCGSILDQTIYNLQYAIEESNAKITCDPMPVVMGDEVQLQRVFQNLISNAIKFKKEEEPPKIHISCREDENNKEYVFEVADNGIGIEKQYADRIFIIFQRLHTRDEYHGTGIGLSIVKRIIERHGGRIWVESESGVGSTFKFTVPY